MNHFFGPITYTAMYFQSMFTFDFLVIYLLRSGLQQNKLYIRWSERVEDCSRFVLIGLFVSAVSFVVGFV